LGLEMPRKLFCGHLSGLCRMSALAEPACLIQKHSVNASATTFGGSPFLERETSKSLPSFLQEVFFFNPICLFLLLTLDLLRLNLQVIQISSSGYKGKLQSTLGQRSFVPWLPRLQAALEQTWHPLLLQPQHPGFLLTEEEIANNLLNPCSPVASLPSFRKFCLLLFL